MARAVGLPARRDDAGRLVQPHPQDGRHGLLAADAGSLHLQRRRPRADRRRVPDAARQRDAARGAARDAARGALSGAARRRGGSALQGGGREQAGGRQPDGAPGAADGDGGRRVGGRGGAARAHGAGRHHGGAQLQVLYVWAGAAAVRLHAERVEPEEWLRLAQLVRQGRLQEVGLRQPAAERGARGRQGPSAHHDAAHLRGTPRWRSSIPRLADQPALLCPKPNLPLTHSFASPTPPRACEYDRPTCSPTASRRATASGTYIACRARTT